MEPFFDGGLFELLIALCAGYSINFIFSRKILLVLFSVMALAAPVLLFIGRNRELVYWMLGISLFNAALLVVLLWKQKMNSGSDAPLFNLKKFSGKFFKRKITTAEINNA